MEIWAGVFGFEDLYEVSDHGRVKSLDRNIITSHGVKKHYRGKLLSPHSGGGNRQYCRVSLWRANKLETEYVHRLVARAFIGPCPEGHEVNHKNSNTTDNRIENLEYLTSSQNKQHYHLLHRGIISGENNWNAKLKEVDVAAIRLLTKNGFPQKYVAGIFGVGQPAVEKIVLGLRWKEVH